MDIVIPTIRDLEFLEEWKHILSDHHLIVMQDGDPEERDIQVPGGYDYDLYDWNDIEEDLGEQSWIMSRGDSAIRSYGFLKAESRYVYTLDDDCFPATDPEGNTVDPVQQHKENLSTPAHPDFFNTLYDQKFVGGVPFDRREGVPTAISHGIWLGTPDFGAPGQMIRPNWRNERYVDAVQTVPRGVMYPMSGMNLAFDSELIGPAMYFGLNGEGWPWARHGDMWAGWVSKTIADHLGYGVKTGKPYIRHESRSDWKSNLRKEYKGIFWEEEIISYLEEMELSEDCETVSGCYLEIADHVEDDLVRLDDYFSELAEAIRVWIDLWN